MLKLVSCQKATGQENKHAGLFDLQSLKGGKLSGRGYWLESRSS
jgi:hypothetical protein